MYFAFAFMFLFLQNVSSFDCLDQSGNKVDYWVIIKKPKGTEYFYYDSNDKIFNISPYSLNDTSIGALTYTTKQLWHTDSNYVIYNDQIPKQYTMNNNIINNTNMNNTTYNYGHTKGFFSFDKNNNGFWITHSIPQFPVGPKKMDNYIGLGSNSWTYSQNMLCLSVKANTINELSNKFLLNKPQIYDSNIITTIYKYINELVDGKYSTEKICESSILSTKNGMNFKVFAKTAEWNNDLYSECITPIEKDSLWVESWIRGSAEGPICPISDYDTLDIKYLDFGNNSSWSETQDHSKWAITVNKHLICMGDINRMTTQYLRGGGTACFTDEILHSVLKKATIETNSCN
jgi:deoxyribonuclease-2